MRCLHDAVNVNGTSGSDGMHTFQHFFLRLPVDDGGLSLCVLVPSFLRVVDESTLRVIDGLALATRRSLSAMLCT